MATRSLGLVATLALTATAFLLPPDLSTADVKGDSDLSTWTLIDPSNGVLLVPCEGCKTSSDDENNLFMNISVGSQPGTLELGGKIFYPPKHFIDDQSAESPYVLEVPTDITLVDIRSDFPSYSENGASVTGWGFASSSSETLESGDEVLSMTLSVNMINMQRVNVPSIGLQVLKRSDGTMFILSTTVDELKKDSGKEQCDSPLCDWQKLFEDRLHSITTHLPKMPKIGKPWGKPCKGMKGMGLHHGHRGHEDESSRLMDGENGHDSHPGVGHHGYHHAHHKLHRFIHLFSKFFMAIAIPVLVGVAAGIATYAVGMVLGCAVALIWVKFVRRGRHGYAGVALCEDEAMYKEVDIVSAKQFELDAEPRASFESCPPVYEEKETVVQQQ